MIRSFRHKGLRRLFEEDDPRGVPVQFAPKIRRVLAQLNVSEAARDMDGMPGWRLHPLKGDRMGQWAVMVTGNLRITFRFEGVNAHDIDLVDYH